MRPVARAGRLKGGEGGWLRAAGTRAKLRAQKGRAVEGIGLEKKLNNVEEDLGKTSGKPREDFRKTSRRLRIFSAAFWKKTENV